MPAAPSCTLHVVMTDWGALLLSVVQFVCVDTTPEGPCLLLQAAPASGSLHLSAQGDDVGCAQVKFEVSSLEPPAPEGQQSWWCGITLSLWSADRRGLDAVEEANAAGVCGQHRLPWWSVVKRPSGGLATQC